MRKGPYTDSLKDLFITVDPHVPYAKFDPYPVPASSQISEHKFESYTFDSRDQVKTRSVKIAAVKAQKAETHEIVAELLRERKAAKKCEVPKEGSSIEYSDPNMSAVTRQTFETTQPARVEDRLIGYTKEKEQRIMQLRVLQRAQELRCMQTGVARVSFMKLLM